MEIHLSQMSICTGQDSNIHIDDEESMGMCLGCTRTGLCENTPDIEANRRVR